MTESNKCLGERDLICKLWNIHFKQMLLFLISFNQIQCKKILEMMISLFPDKVNALKF
jgi:hypothetical protein